MNDNNNDLRDERPAEAAPERLMPVASDPVLLPTPEPLLSGEPPPMPPIGADAGTDPVALAPSWRNFVGSPRATHDDSPQSEPASSDPSAHGSDPTGGLDQSAVVGRETVLTHDNASPTGDGGARGEAASPAVVALTAAENPVEAPGHRESSVTLSRVGEELFAWLKTLASAAVYATLIVTFGFQVARVEGQSMAPTLENQDRLIVNKLAYRLGQPQVGDIVMLYYPLNPDKSFVKRVIAEEGDQIRIVDGRVLRNDVPLNDDYVPPEYRSHDDWGPEVVPQGYYFVMGDHRNNSSDSRHWRFVPKKYIIGKVQLRWWPLPQARIFRSQQ